MEAEYKWQVLAQQLEKEREQRQREARFAPRRGGASLQLLLNAPYVCHIVGRSGDDKRVCNLMGVGPGAGVEWALERAE